MGVQLVNEMRHAVQVLTECRDACESLIDRGKAVDGKNEIDITTVETIREATTALKSELAGATGRNRRVRSSFRLARALPVVRRLCWVILYAVTVFSMIWWYQLRPAWLAHRRLQGNWQYTEGFGPDERRKEAFFHVDGSDTWLAYPFRAAWTVSRSRISIRPATGFFTVRRQFGFDYGTTRETEYIVRLVDDRLYLVRGMATLDAMMERKIEKLRRVEDLPPEARQMIEPAKSGSK